MNTMDTPRKPGIMAQLRNSKGFSLIEIAIVLVIIGIIIAAIVKGQDLLVNARTKQLVAAANTWKSAAYGYMDRNGTFPGDTGNKNGLVGDDSTSTIEQVATGTAIAQLEGAMSALPTNPVVVGGMSFYFFFGNARTATGSLVSVIAICKVDDCNTVFTPDEVALINAADTAIDGAADGGSGAFRASTTTGFSPATATATRANGYINGGVALSTANTPFSIVNKAALWAFDRAF